MRGVTLLEMVLVLVILSIIAALGSSFLSGGLNAYFTERDISDAAWQGRLALERITRDLRTVRSATAGDLTISPANQISFIDTSGTSVAYSLSGTTLMRNGQPLADGITSLTFTYIANDGKTTAATVTAVYYIGVSFTVTQGGTNQAWRDLIHPRSIP
jgi:prepilin-type N-terminal cleavage/methylation domain-containing protein